jgi:chaperonin GroEL
MEKVMFNENVKEKLINGVNLLADAVKTTYGPNGQNVIIKHRGGIHIT